MNRREAIRQGTKKAAREPLFQDIVEMAANAAAPPLAAEVSEAFFRQAGSGRRALAGLEFRV